MCRLARLSSLLLTLQQAACPVCLHSRSAVSGLHCHVMYLLHVPLHRTILDQSTCFLLRMNWPSHPGWVSRQPWEGPGIPGWANATCRSCFVLQLL